MAGGLARLKPECKVTPEEAVSHITNTEELYALGTATIRGIEMPVFKNAAIHIAELLDLCDDYGDAEFLVFEQERYGYAEYKDQVNRLAVILKDRFDVSKGDKVAICMRNSPEYLTAIMAIASLGGVIVFLNSWWTTQELEYGFSDSGAKLAFVDPRVAERIAPFDGRLDIRLILVRSTEPDELSYSALMRDTVVHESLKVDIHTDDDMAIMYTSGSTGKPKGVIQTHRGAISALMSWLLSGRVADLTGSTPALPKDVTGQDIQASSLITTPLFHVSATHACFLLGLAAGAKLVMMNKWDPIKAIELIERENITRFFGVPTMSADLVDKARELGKPLSSLRTVDAGGAKRPASHVDKISTAFPSAEPRTGYGLTETNALGLGLGGNDYIASPGVAGRLYPPLQSLRIVDENGQDVPTGQSGELILKSAANMRGYYNQAQATSQALKDGWLYTGDLATTDADGIVTIVDRKKDIIIRGGENISCLEVDAALHLHPAIIEAAVFSIPDERLGEIVGAGVHLYPGQELSQRDLQTFLEIHLAKFKIPEKVWFRGALPRGGTEKTDRRALRQECL